MGRFEVKQFSSIYNVRKMTEEDLLLISELMRGNEQYYQYCGRTYSVEEVKNDLQITPPGKELDDKYYVGFFERETLVAVMDLIDGYPEPEIAYIGFFMMNKAYQGCGKGTGMIQEVCVFLKETGMQKVRLGIDKENPQSNHFWKKNGFCVIYEVEQEAETIVVAERELQSAGGFIRSGQEGVKQMISMNKYEKTFDNSAQDYDDTRPMYCPELYRDLLQYQPLDAGCRALEIGIGTGKATLPILQTGCHVTGIEPGEHLADYTIQRFGTYQNFELRCQTLQEFEAPQESFDLIYAATAFHWIPEEYGYPRVFELLKKGGTFARFAYHAGPDQGRLELAEEIQKLYTQYMGRTGKGKAYGEKEAEELVKIADKYGFRNTEYKLYHWKKDFTADEYMLLLKTYPDHMKLEAEKRKGLFEGIYRAIQKYGGVITVYYTMDMQLARK